MASCVNCGSDFSGKRSDAKYCSESCGNRARNSRHYARNPVQFAAQRKYYNSNVPARIHSRVKSRARRKNIPFDISVSDIVVPDVCPVLGIKIVPQTGKGSGFHDNSPSLDRIIPTLGYTKGNVRVISSRANLLKSNATVWELEAVLYDLRRLKC